jgi:hypothetical protein
MYPRPTTGAINRKTTKSSETVDASSLSSRTNKKEKPYELSYIRYPPRPFLPIELTQAIATFFHPLQRACCALTVSKSLELGNPFMSSRAALFHAFELQLPAPIQVVPEYPVLGLTAVLGSIYQVLRRPTGIRLCGVQCQFIYIHICSCDMRVWECYRCSCDILISNLNAPLMEI